MSTPGCLNQPTFLRSFLDEGLLKCDFGFLQYVVCSVVGAGKVLGDGVFHVLVLRKPISRAAVLDLFLQIETGQHVHGKQVHS